MKDHIEALKEITSALIEKSLAQERFERRKDVLIEILTTLNFLDDEKTSVDRLIEIIKNYTNMEAIGLRLKLGDDYPYYAVTGFSDDFLVKENSLRCQEEIFGEKEDDLECMCGYVIKGRGKEEYPFFTEYGSFFIGDATGLVNGKYGPLPVDIKVRGVCIKSGFETVVAIPLRCKSDKTIGILQLNDSRPHAMSIETVKFFEGIGLNIGVALSRIRMFQTLRERCRCRHDRSDEDNEL